VLVRLSPTEVSVGDRTVPCEPAFGAEAWHGAVSALDRLGIGQRCRVTVVLSNHFVRYALIPWSDALASEAEEEAYVRHHFARIHGDRAKAWAVRASDGGSGAPRLASAIENALLDALRACFPARGKAKLVSVQPALMELFNRARGSIPRSGAWLVLAEPDRACIALHAGRHWRAVQSAKDAWLTLLERMRLTVEGEVPQLVLLHGPDGVDEAPGWQVARVA
jgi:hypothetical protein